MKSVGWHMVLCMLQLRMYAAVPTCTNR